MVWGESPNLPTGNSNLTRYLVPHLESLGYSTKLLGFRTTGQAGRRTYHFGPKVKYTYDELPTFNPMRPADHESFRYWMQHTQPDLLFTVGDMNWYEICSHMEIKNWLCYLAVDSAPLNAWREVISKIPYIVSPTQWATDELIKIGTPPIATIRHGIDLRFFPRLSDVERRRMKEKFGLENRVIIGGVGDNASRKNWNVWIDTFRRVKARIPNAMGLLHVQPMGDTPINDIILSAGLQDDIIIAKDPLIPISKIGFEDVWQPYSLMDVLLHVSSAGAWEYPIIEAEASGVPVVAVDYAGMRESALSEYLVQPSGYTWQKGATLWAIPNGEAMARRCIQYLQEPPKDLIELGRKHAEWHSWDKRLVEWTKILNHILPRDLPEAWRKELKQSV